MLKIYYGFPPQIVRTSVQISKFLEKKNGQTFNFLGFIVCFVFTIPEGFEGKGEITRYVHSIFKNSPRPIILCLSGC